MSGHSHWSTIKHKKGAEDAKKGKIFSKISRMVSVAAKEGKDPETNTKLRQAIEEAKKVNMPKENIERAIKKGTGELEGEQLEEVSFEALGPEGISIIMEGITDNKNRTLSEVKQILSKYNGKLADEGSVKWAFEQKGIILAKGEKQELELKAIESGAEDIFWHEGMLEIQTKPEELGKVRGALEKKGVEIESSSLGWAAKEEIEGSKKAKEVLEKIFEELDENDAIQNIYSNLQT